MKPPFNLLRIFCGLLFFAGIRNEGHAAVMELFCPALKTAREEADATRRSLEKIDIPLAGHTTPQIGFMHEVLPNFKEDLWVQINLRSPELITQIAVVPVHLKDSTEVLSYGFPVRFRIELSNDKTFSKPNPVFDSTKSDFPSPEIGPLIVEVPGIRAEYVRLTVVSPRKFALSEIMVMSGNRNVAIGCEVEATHSAQAPSRWDSSNLVDGRTPLGLPVRSEPVDSAGLFAGPLNEDALIWMGVDLRRTVPVEEIRLHPVHSLRADLPGYGFPTAFRIEAGMDPGFSDTKLLFNSGDYYPNPGDNVVVIPMNNVPIRYLRLVLMKAGTLIDPKRFGLTEMEVYSSGKNIAPEGEVLSVLDPKSNNGSRTLLTDGKNSFGTIIEVSEWLRMWAARRALSLRLIELDRLQGDLMQTATARMLWSGGCLALLVTSAALFALFRSRQFRKAEIAQFRRQLANDLHDEVGSNLAAIGMISDTAAASDKELGSAPWKKVSGIIQETITAMRETLWVAGGGQVVLDLMAHMELAAARMLPGKQVVWETRTEKFPENFSQESRRQVFLFFKETLANIVRHSEARSVSLSARLIDSTFSLVIRDDGKGFDPLDTRRGIGLHSMRDRARRLGGAFDIQTSQGSGTTVTLTIKLNG